MVLSPYFISRNQEPRHEGWSLYAFSSRSTLRWSRAEIEFSLKGPMTRLERESPTHPAMRSCLQTTKF